MHRWGKSLPHYSHDPSLFISTQRSQLEPLPLLSVLPQRRALRPGWPRGCRASAVQISKYRCWEVSAEPASAPASRCKCSHCSPSRAGSCSQQCLNTNSLLTWQTNSLLHSPAGRSITEQSPPCSRQGFLAPAWVSYLALRRSCCRMLLLGDVLSQTPADPLLLLLGVSLQT